MQSVRRPTIESIKVRKKKSRVLLKGAWRAPLQHTRCHLPAHHSQYPLPRSPQVSSQVMRPRTKNDFYLYQRVKRHSEGRVADFIFRKSPKEFHGPFHSKCDHSRRYDSLEPSSFKKTQSQLSSCLPVSLNEIKGLKAINWYPVHQAKVTPLGCRHVVQLCPQDT